MLTSRGLLARTAMLVCAVLLAATGAVLGLVAPVAAQPGVNCPNDTPPRIDQAACDLGGQSRQVGEGPFVLEKPGSYLGCARRVSGYQLDSEMDFETLRDRGPIRIRCEWNGIGREAIERGFYTHDWDCYVRRRAELQPEPGMVGYEVNGGEGGLVYGASCYPPPRAPVRVGETARDLAHWLVHESGQYFSEDNANWSGPPQLVVLPEVPPPAAPTPTLFDLWVDAINSLEMWGPVPATAPPLHTSGLVNLPMWLWTEETGRTWPDQLSASVTDNQTWWIDAYAEPLRMDWEMGDGGTADCPEHSPGAAYEIGMDFLEPPVGACRYTYRRPSRDQPGGVYEILALTTWRVWWYINDELDNEVEFQVGNYVSFRVDELQVLTGR